MKHQKQGRNFAIDGSSNNSAHIVIDAQRLQVPDLGAFLLNKHSPRKATRRSWQMAPKLQGAPSM